MKLLNREIDMISWTSREGVVTPVRFRILENGESVVIRVDRILQTEQTRFAGTPTLYYRCCSNIKGTEKIYELSYNCSNQKWLLRKM